MAEGAGVTDFMEQKDLLLFCVGGQTFALPAAVVEVAMAPQPVTPLPFVPDYVEGMVNAGERIVPQLALQRLLFPAEAMEEEGHGELLIVDMGYASCALHVERIIGRIQVEAGQIRPVQTAHEASAALLFNAQCEHEGDVFLVLDPAQLSALMLPREVAEGARGLLGRLQTEDYDDQHDEMPCIVVRVGGERYAVALGDVMEILDTPPATPLPGAPAMIEGMSLVRDEVLLVLSLAQLLNRGETCSGARHVLVTEFGRVRYGIRVDAVEGIVAFDARTYRVIDDEASEVARILVHEEQLVGLLTPSRMLTPAREALVRSFVPEVRQRQAVVPVAMQSVLQVIMADEEYALPLDRVRRVVPYTPPEALDVDEGALIRAVANVDGSIVPMVDLAAQLSLARDIKPTVWVIVGSEQKEWAIPVTRACDIMEIPVTAVEAIDSRRSRFVAGVATVDRRLISLISLAPLENEARLQEGLA